MSDYISKSEAIHTVTKVELKDGTFAEVKMGIGELPTLDEKEIIRKAFEGVYKRMKAISYREEPNDCDPFGDVPHYVVSLPAIKQILKEECEINE